MKERKDEETVAQGVVRLRTLTLKSKVPYGRYEGMEVDKVLAFSKMAIRYLYYCVQWITFTDDILDAVGIKGSWRIEKPATNRVAYERWRGIMFDQLYGEKGRFVKLGEEKKRKRRILKDAEKREELSQAVMQAQNHGHIKF